MSKKLLSYIFGFVLSLVLTLAAFGAVQAAPLVPFAVPLLVALGVAQLMVQLILFLHLGEEPHPRWNLLALCFALVVVGILVGGSLWIMNHLSLEHPHYDVFEQENITPHDHSNTY